MRTLPRLMFDLSAAFAVCALATPAATFAQAGAPADEPAAATGDAGDAGDAAARRQMLNAEQAAAARAQVEANRASEDHHDTAVALNEMQSEREGARYADALARHDEAEQAYRQDRTQWERRNPYCWNGDAARCPADPTLPGSGD
ncbi:hypothetical protein [Novosphingobium sp. BL-52-GroH]|uniref:hypothetical protein n=1 Tax=Novosphingobium sp. BL-52-GroH TaxID=3349877 RepID=UPI00384CEAA5